MATVLLALTAAISKANGTRKLYLVELDHPVNREEKSSSISSPLRQMFSTSSSLLQVFHRMQTTQHSCHIVKAPSLQN